MVKVYRKCHLLTTEDNKWKRYDSAPHFLAIQKEENSYILTGLGFPGAAPDTEDIDLDSPDVVIHFTRVLTESSKVNYNFDRPPSVTITITAQGVFGIQYRSADDCQGFKEAIDATMEAIANPPPEDEEPVEASPVRSPNPEPERALPAAPSTVASSAVLPPARPAVAAPKSSLLTSHKPESSVVLADTPAAQPVDPDQGPLPATVTLITGRQMTLQQSAVPSSVLDDIREELTAVREDVRQLRTDVELRLQQMEKTIVQAVVNALK
ncbi:hypothetical protein J8273_1717 [Carpediemonas membranifera]|uniref:PH domain-containing protein n=1 Tax=Carpediemonas membranifera TaxID=201153 RepID=A0A8J6E1R4_9EUKA|nr:hypothetical protein J8273_1717 [Carpediemonas membranifera]|eukprot:KAG9396699.1 hypothetical protein J8273_1717 [Carpediemonas membranifera]